jgi:hypothetical protein
MCSGCEQGISSADPIRIQQWDDQEQAWLRETIRKHGWAIQAVYADPDQWRPPFAYTVGLTRFGHPELVVFGLHQSAAAVVLNALGTRASAGLRLGDGMLFAAGAVGPTALRMAYLPNPEEVLFTAVGRYGPRVRAMQVIVADESGKFPDEPEYQGAVWLQPPPGTFAA